MKACTRCPYPLAQRDAIPDDENPDKERHRRCLSEDPLPKRRPPKIRRLYEEDTTDDDRS